jgi:hypothetical protein
VSSGLGDRNTGQRCENRGNEESVSVSWKCED